MAYNDGNPGATPVEAEDAPAGAGSWWRPPAPPEEKRRHFAWVKVLVAVVVVLALVAGGLGVRAYLQHSSASSKQAAVRQAYLGWWTAREKAYLALDPSGLKGLMTPAGYKQESAQVQQQAATGDPFRLVADHNVQVAVYSGTPYASVDDVWADHSVALDPVTHQPVQPDPDITIEDSATLKLVGGHWLVGELYRFGVSRSLPGQTISYAAMVGGKPLMGAIRAQIQNSFDRFLTGVAPAFLSSNGAGMANLTMGNELAQIQGAIAQDRELHRGLRSKSQINTRMALQDNLTAWVYDSYYETYSYIDSKTRRQVGASTTTIGHVAYRLVKEPRAWKVDYSLGS